MKSDDLKNAPKLFCESIQIGRTPEYFAIGLNSGNQAHIFSLTPQHAKRLLQYLTYEITEFEKKHGSIETTWVPHVKSPIQRSNPPSSRS
jgi:hypothetical protein